MKQLILCGALALLSSACGVPLRPVESTHPAPAAFLSHVRDTQFADAAAMLAADVTLIDASGAQNGTSAVTAALPNLPAKASALIDKHHRVARMNLTDGSMLFAKCNEDGAISHLLHFAPVAQNQVPVPAALTAYQTAWNVGAAQRQELLRTAWTNDSEYVDPSANGKGVTELSAIIDAFRSQFPGVTLTSENTMQQLPQGWVTFNWTIHASGDALDGFDVGQLNDNGQPLVIYGFFLSRQKD